VNAEVHRERREAFLDVAQRLIQTKGYEQMSIQDVLDQLETSKGSLYHYFDSKQALLDGVVERFGEAAIAAVHPILADPDLPALRKLERVMREIAEIKAEQKDLVLAILEVWNSDGNALVREKLRELAAARLGPILTSIIRQGVDEGVIESTSPEETAMVVLCLLQGYQDLVSKQFLARRSGAITFADVMRTHAAFTEAFERILDVPRGSVVLTDERTMRFWLG
jgi:AcrR family transcriptional regulator